MRSIGDIGRRGVPRGCDASVEQLLLSLCTTMPNAREYARFGRGCPCDACSARFSRVLLITSVSAWPMPLAAQGTPTPVARTGPQDVILATTTSTADTGLLDALAPLFLEQTGYTLKPIAVGSGAALELGERGEADVVLAHSPAAEEDLHGGGLRPGPPHGDVQRLRHRRPPRRPGRASKATPPRSTRCA